MGKKSKDKKWYALVGSNAIGIYNNYYRAEEAGAFVFKRIIKGFNTFKQARKYAISEYAYRSDGEFFLGPVPANFTIYENDMRAIEALGLDTDASIKVVFKGKKKIFEEIKWD